MFSIIAMTLCLSVQTAPMPPLPSGTTTPEDLTDKFEVSNQGSYLLYKREGGRAKKFNLRQHLSSDGDCSWVLLNRQIRGRNVYLLFNASGNSRTGATTGNCAAGTETDLIWIRIYDSSIRAIRTECIESCYQSSEFEEGRSGNQRTWTVTRPSKDHRSRSCNVITFNEEHPEQGLHVGEIYSCK